MKSLIRILAAAALVIAGSFSAGAAPIPVGPGFDLFATASSPASFVDLTLFSGGLVGVVPLTGNPFGPGDTDTIVERLTGTLTTFDVGDVETVDIELVALSLQSVDPVDIGGTLFDMDVISGALLGEPANPLGTMTISHEHPNGGTFITDILPIDYKATFTEVGTPSNTFNVLGNIQFFNSQGGLWSHTPGPMDVHNASLPHGDFYAGIDPATGEKRSMAHVTSGEAHYTLAAMSTTTIVPEPSTVLLLGTGLVGLIGYGHRRRKAA